MNHCHQLSVGKIALSSQVWYAILGLSYFNQVVNYILQHVYLILPSYHTYRQALRSSSTALQTKIAKHTDVIVTWAFFYLYTWRKHLLTNEDSPFLPQFATRFPSIWISCTSCVCNLISRILLVTSVCPVPLRVVCKGYHSSRRLCQTCLTRWLHLQNLADLPCRVRMLQFIRNFSLTD